MLRISETKEMNLWICCLGRSPVMSLVSSISQFMHALLHSHMRHKGTELTLAASDPSAAARRRKPGQDASHFKTDKSGKLLIDEPAQSSGNSGPSEVERMAGDAFLANQTSTDGATRDARGALKFNKNTKRSRETEREYEMTFGAGIIDQDDKDKVKKKKKEVTKLGEEFRSKVRHLILSPYHRHPSLSHLLVLFPSR